MYSASAPLGREGGQPKLRVQSGAGLAPGSAYDLTEGALLGRGDQADIRLEDGFASSRHARLIPQGDVMVLEDLGSTNGTYLNGEPLRGPQPLHAGDRIKIGDSEFSFER
jgi:predicted component of type VI protein secretion system